MMRREMTEADWVAHFARIDKLAARPDVAAIIDRATRLTPEERTALHEAWLPHFRLYRLALSDLFSRCREAYGEDWRDVLAVKDKALRAERGALGIYQGDAWGAAHAVEDAVEAVLFAPFLEPHEVPLLAGPWERVVGPINLEGGGSDD